MAILKMFSEEYNSFSQTSDLWTGQMPTQMTQLVCLYDAPAANVSSLVLVIKVQTCEWPVGITGTCLTGAALFVQGR